MTDSFTQDGSDAGNASQWRNEVRSSEPGTLVQKTRGGGAGERNDGEGKQTHHQRSRQRGQ